MVRVSVRLVPPAGPPAGPNGAEAVHFAAEVSCAKPWDAIPFRSFRQVRAGSGGLAHTALTCSADPIRSEEGS
ncbi:hypothetical protein GCM10023080_067020 [Streptomyces pseudoechinosporeus]